MKRIMVPSWDSLEYETWGFLASMSRASKDYIHTDAPAIPSIQQAPRRRSGLQRTNWEIPNSFLAHDPRLI
jgi:hypothetical protein